MDLLGEVVRVIGAGAEDEQGSGRRRAVIFQVMLRLEFWGLFLFFLVRRFVRILLEV